MLLQRFCYSSLSPSVHTARLRELVPCISLRSYTLAPKDRTRTTHFRRNQFGDLLGDDRCAEIKPLRLGAMLVSQECGLLKGFDALCYDSHVQIPAHVDHCVHDTCIVRVVCEFPNERMIDF